MRKSKNTELTKEQMDRIVSLALEEKNPFDIIKKEFGMAEKDIIELMKKKMSADNFELWKKKAVAGKPKVKAPKIDNFDENLDGKYYFKNKFD